MEKFAWNKKCESLPKNGKFHEEIAKIFVENEENFRESLLLLETLVLISFPTNVKETFYVLFISI